MDREWRAWAGGSAQEEEPDGHSGHGQKENKQGSLAFFLLLADGADDLVIIIIAAGGDLLAVSLAAVLQIHQQFYISIQRGAAIGAEMHRVVIGTSAPGTFFCHGDTFFLLLLRIYVRKYCSMMRRPLQGESILFRWERNSS